MESRTEKDLWVEMSIREISTQAHFADLAYTNIDPKAARGTDAVFTSIHSFLSHCAMVSKMLRATDDDNRTQAIGDAIGVGAASVIHGLRFRNHLEHYDERLKKWIRTFGADSSIGTYNIGPKSALKIPGMIFVSHYDPATHTFTFVNEDFDLSKLHSEALRIKTLADQWVEGKQRGEILPPFV